MRNKRVQNVAANQTSADKLPTVCFHEFSLRPLSWYCYPQIKDGGCSKENDCKKLLGSRWDAALREVQRPTKIWSKVAFWDQDIQRAVFTLSNITILHRAKHIYNKLAQHIVSEFTLIDPLPHNYKTLKIWITIESIWIWGRNWTKDNVRKNTLKSLFWQS